MTKSINIFGREIKLKSGKGSFIKYTYTKDGEKYYDVKFNNRSEAPNKLGYITLTFKEEDANIQRTKEHNRNDILWIKSCSWSVDTEASEKFKKELEEELADLLS